jgi:hypothetical protein
MSDRDTELAWDTTDTRMQVCDMATAIATADQVVLNFGARATDDIQVQAFGVRLLRQIALRPASAKHLRDMLTRAVAERGGPGGRHG